MNSAKPPWIGFTVLGYLRWFSALVGDLSA